MEDSSFPSPNAGTPGDDLVTPANQRRRTSRAGVAINSARGITLLQLMLAILVMTLGLVGHKYSQDHSHLLGEAEQQATSAKQPIEAQRQAFEEKVSVERRKSEYDKSISALKDLHTRWDDAFRLAISTPRMGLPGQISVLQAIKREAESIVVPDCMDAPRKHLIDGMGNSIEAFMAFLANRDSGTNVVASYFDKSNADFAAYTQAISVCLTAN